MTNIGKRILSRAKRLAAQRLVNDSPVCTIDQPIVSFTFDDFPESALTNGGDILEVEGYRGTYYAAFGLAGTESSVGHIATAERMVSCVERGHELACHTHSHIDCADVSHKTLEEERERNQQAADSLGAPRMRNFAYPFGSFDPMSKRWASSHFDSVRTVLPGVNRGKFYMNSLRAMAIYTSIGMDTCARTITELAEKPGWLIFYTHGVSEAPSDYGCTVDEFTSLVRLCSRLKIDVLTVAEARNKILS